MSEAMYEIPSPTEMGSVRSTSRSSTTDPGNIYIFRTACLSHNIRHCRVLQVHPPGMPAFHHVGRCLFSLECLGTQLQVIVKVFKTPLLLRCRGSMLSASKSIKRGKAVNMKRRPRFRRKADRKADRVADSQFQSLTVKNL